MKALTFSCIVFLQLILVMPLRLLKVPRRRALAKISTVINILSNLVLLVFIHLITLILVIFLLHFQQFPKHLILVVRKRRPSLQQLMRRRRLRIRRTAVFFIPHLLVLRLLSLCQVLDLLAHASDFFYESQLGEFRWLAFSCDFLSRLVWWKESDWLFDELERTACCRPLLLFVHSQLMIDIKYFIFL